MTRTHIFPYLYLNRRIPAQVIVKQFIDGHMYDTRSSVLIGEREERGSFMYKTDEGVFFIYHSSVAQTHCLPWINPISRNVAIRRHFRYSHNQLAFEDAFGE